MNIPEAHHKIAKFEFLLSDEDLERNSHYFDGKLSNKSEVREAIAIAGLTMPAYCDLPSLKATYSYKAWPARMVLIGKNGAVIHDFGLIINGGGWHLDALEKQLQSLEQQEALMAEKSIS